MVWRIAWCWKMVEEQLTFSVPCMQHAQHVQFSFFCVFYVAFDSYWFHWFHLSLRLFHATGNVRVGGFIHTAGAPELLFIVNDGEWIRWSRSSSCCLLLLRSERFCKSNLSSSFLQQSLPGDFGPTCLQRGHRSFEEPFRTFCSSSQSSLSSVAWRQSRPEHTNMIEPGQDESQ